MAKFDPILEELNVTPGELALIQGADTANTGEISSARAIETVYTAKRQSDLVTRLIESNHELAESNSKQARAMTWLTVALVLISLAQVIIAALREG